MATVAEVVNLLNLFDTPAGIAKALSEKGITGERQKSTACPIANLIKRETNVRYVRVGSCYATVHISENQIEHPEYYEFSSTVSEFVELFDSNEWPSLVTPRRKSNRCGMTSPWFMLTNYVDQY